MKFRNRIMSLRWAAPLVLAVLVAGCGPSAESAVPTRPPAPTFTPTVQGQAAPVDPAVAAAAAQVPPQPATEQSASEQPVGEQPATPAADAPAGEAPAAEAPVVETPAAPPTATPEPVTSPAEVVIDSQINVRGGPGTNYNIVGAANQGQRYPVTGRNNDGSWWQINFNGQQGWVFAELVTEVNTQSVAVAINIPAPPPPTATSPAPPPPPPTNTPVPQPVAQEPAPQEPAPAEPAPAEPAPPADNGNFPFVLIDDFVRCAPNEATTYFQGYVRDRNNNLKNAVCVHIAYYEPRNTKCSGCDGVGDGNWGFSPFGGPAPAGTFVEIFVVACPSGGMPEGGQTQVTGFGDLTPQSPKWTRTIQQSEQCTEITFAER